MNIALDFDNTFSADPAFWRGFILTAREAGHDVRIVTTRDDRFDRTAPLIELESFVEVIYTRGVAKRHLLTSDPDASAFKPHVYIDDKPESIIANSTTSPEDLAKWRADRGEGISIPRGCSCA